MKKRRRAARSATPSSVVLAAIATSARDRTRTHEIRLLAVEIESLAPRVRARLEDDRAESDLERRRLLDRLARLEKAMEALSSRSGSLVY